MRVPVRMLLHAVPWLQEGISSTRLLFVPLFSRHGAASLCRPKRLGPGHRLGHTGGPD